MNIVELDYDSLKKDVLFEKGFLLINKLFTNEAKATMDSLSFATSSHRFQKSFKLDEKDQYKINNYLIQEEFKGFINSVFDNNFIVSNNFFLRIFKKCQGTLPHADHVYFKQTSPILTVWVALKKISLEMGPLFVVPRDESSILTDKEYLDKAIDSNDATGNTGWEAATISIDKVKTIYTKHLEPGDTFLFFSDIVHGTLDANSNLKRYSLDFRITSKLDHDTRWFS
jgi:hypothetical protein